MRRSCRWWHSWAACTTLEVPDGLAAELDAYVTARQYHSKRWLTAAQAALLYAASTYEGGVTVPLPSAAAARPCLLAQLPPDFQLALWNEHPLTRRELVQPSVLDVVDSDELPPRLHWRAASVEEVFHATARYDASLALPNEVLLVSEAAASAAGVPLQADAPVEMVTMLNAQDTTLPFDVDPSLVFVDVFTGEPIDDVVASYLSSTTALRRFRTLWWLRHDPKQPSSLVPRSNEGPTVAQRKEPMSIYHVSQLREEYASQLESRVPWFAKNKVRPLRTAAGKWVNVCRPRFEFERGLPRGMFIEASALGKIAHAVPLEHVLQGNSHGQLPQPLVIHFMSCESFYNLEQLESSDTATDNPEATASV